jgi:hypothetical protein
VGVEPGGDEHDLRTEPLDRGRDGVVEGAEVLLVARAGAHRDVQRRLGLVARPSRARIERPLVQGHVEDGVVREEDVLRPVAVVDVEVDDRDAADAVRLERARGDRDVVEDAEAHRVALRRVVAGRPHEREAAAARGLDRCADGEERRLPRRLARRRVGVEPRTASASAERSRSRCARPTR